MINPQRRHRQKQRQRPWFVGGVLALLCILLQFWQAAQQHNDDSLMAMLSIVGEDHKGEEQHSSVQRQQQEQQQPQLSDPMAVETAPARLAQTCDMTTCPAALERNVIVFHSNGRFSTWREYYGDKPAYLGGEGYWSASLSLILESLQFRVVSWHDQRHGPYGNWRRWNQQQQKRRSMSRWFSSAASSNDPSGMINESHVHRIIADCDTHYTRRALYNPTVMCKRRLMDWWSLASMDDANNDENNKNGDSCILSPFARSYSGSNSTTTAPSTTTTQSPSFHKNVWIPFLAHSQVMPREAQSATTTAAEQQRHNNVFLLSKRCSFPPDIISRLVDDLGLHLHATCFLGKRSSSNKDLERILQRYSKPRVRGYGNKNHNNTTSTPTTTNDGPGFTNHGKLTPLQFQRLLRQMNLVIGFGHPLLSPTPLEALAQGCAFLNPRLHRRRVQTQNDALRWARIGEPYVYEYEMIKPNTNHTTTTTTTTTDKDPFANLLEQVRRALQQSPQRAGRGFVPPYASVCELRQRICQSLIRDDINCQATNNAKQDEENMDDNNRMPAKPCFNTCGKAPGLRDARYQEDLKLIQQEMQQHPHNLSRLLELSQSVKPYKEDGK